MARSKYMKHMWTQLREKGTQARLPLFLRVLDVISNADALTVIAEINNLHHKAMLAKAYNSDLDWIQDNKPIFKPVHSIKPTKNRKF